ncbi:Hint domain-containing protein [Maritalea sp.]|uniref:Hint domain-containing protein n=1 Tax=Maritalea sp. TaxID=2003361 RepID=UPI003EFA8926
MVDFSNTTPKTPTISQISQLWDFEQNDDLYGYYSYLAELGSDYGKVGRNYHSPQPDLPAQISNFYTSIVSGGKFQVGNELYDQVAHDLMRAHFKLILEDGEIPTTDEIFAIHREVFNSAGIGAHSWIGNFPLLAPWVDVGMGWEPSDSPEIFFDTRVVPGLIGLYQCFPADVQILLAENKYKQIGDIKIGDIVASFESASGLGRGAFSDKRVVRLFENVTDVWIELSNGLTVTPGHRFLTSDGSFRSIETILAGDSIVIDEAGEELHVTCEYIRYSDETADLYEQAEMYVAVSAGSSALVSAD